MHSLSKVIKIKEAEMAEEEINQHSHYRGIHTVAGGSRRYNEQQQYDEE